MEPLPPALVELPAQHGLQVLVVLITAATMPITKVEANVVRTSNKEVRLNSEATAALALVSHKQTVVPATLLHAVTMVTAIPLAAQAGVKVLAPVLQARQEAPEPADLPVLHAVAAPVVAVHLQALVDHHLAAPAVAQEEDDNKY